MQNTQLNQYQSTPHTRGKKNYNHPQQAGLQYPQQQYNVVPPPCYGPAPTQMQYTQMPQQPQMQMQYTQMPQQPIQSGIPPQMQYAQLQPQPIQSGMPQHLQPNVPQQSGQKQKHNEPNKYKNVPCNLMYGLFQNCNSKINEAATANNVQSSACGIIFYIADVHERDANNKPIKWKAPNLGMAVNLNEEQVAHLVEYLNISADPFGHGRKQTTHPTKHTNTVVQPPVQVPPVQTPPPQMNYSYPSQTGNSNVANNPPPVDQPTQQNIDDFFDF